MKVVFLDIDGVLNTGEYLAEISKDPVERKVLRATIANYSKMIDPRASALLNVITEKTGAKIVVSSTWRILHSWDDLVWMLKNRGVIGDLLDKTPKRGRDRGHEIGMWLNKHPEVTHFVILDDDCDIDPFASHHVKTKFRGPHGGLQQGHVTRAIEMLGTSDE